MRIKAIAALVTLACAMPVTGAHAGQCETRIFLLNSYNVPAADHNAQTVTTSAVGCTVIGGDDPNTDYIYPGSDRWFVRWTVNSKPTHGTLTFNGTTIDLTFSQGKLEELVEDQPWFDSQWITVDPATTLQGGAATITVCQGAEGEDEDCDTRTYRTLG